MLRTTSRKSAPSKFSTTAAAGGLRRRCPAAARRRAAGRARRRRCPCRCARDRLSGVGGRARLRSRRRAGCAPVRGGRRRTLGVGCVAQAASAAGDERQRAQRSAHGEAAMRHVVVLRRRLARGVASVDRAVVTAGRRDWSPCAAACSAGRRRASADRRRRCRAAARRGAPALGRSSPTLARRRRAPAAPAAARAAGARGARRVASASATRRWRLRPFAPTAPRRRAGAAPAGCAGVRRRDGLDRRLRTRGDLERAAPRRRRPASSRTRSAFTSATTHAVDRLALLHACATCRR